MHKQDVVRGLAHGADDFVVAIVANQQNLVAITDVSDGFDMNLCDERARGIDHIEFTTLRHAPHDGSDAMRAKDDARAGGHIRDFFNEYRALSFKVTHDEEVVDDLTTHIDGRTIIRQGQLDGFDCPDDARAETAGLCKDDSFDCHGTFTFYAGIASTQIIHNTHSPALPMRCCLMNGGNIGIVGVAWRATNTCSFRFPRRKTTGGGP